jgi:hypothetical protein
MIQLLLILSIIICLIILLLSRKEQFNPLPAISSLKATGGNSGIKLTWIKPVVNIYRYYIILKFYKDNIPNYNIYLYNNNNDLVEFHIKNIPNDYIYNVSIIYSDSESMKNISELETYTNEDGSYDVITDKNSPLNFSDFKSTESNENISTHKNCELDRTENINMDVQNIINLLINKNNSDHKDYYNINIY